MLAELIANSGANALPLVCLEVNPPRGVTAETIFERLDNQLDGIDLLNVTDSALARMKCSSLIFASLLKQRYNVEPLVNVSCRDRNVIALQADLIGGWLLGVRSVVALTGDAMGVGDMPNRKGVFEVNSVGLLDIITQLNNGTDLAGNALKGAPTIVPGVVVNPNAKNQEAELRRLAKKKEAGARYALSQPVFDEERAEQFLRQAAETIGLPIMAGLLPFKNAKAARALAGVPGIKLSPAIETMIAEREEADLSEESIMFCAQLAKRVAPWVRGFHVVCGAAPRLGLSLAQELVSLRKQQLNTLSRCAPLQ